MKNNSVQHEHFQSIIANKPIPSQLVGGFNHLEKYESQWEGLSHI
jgi:hypothetical protein